MDYLLLARVGKLVALIGFLLPWVTVSCSGTEILQATGVQLMTGDLEPSGAFAQMEQTQTDDAEPSIPVILACAALLIGLGAGVLTKGKTAAAAMLIGAVAAIALSYFAIFNMRAEMTRQGEEAQSQQVEDTPYFSAEQQRELTQAAASAIKIEEEEGYWLTMGAAGIAGILSLLVLAGAGGVPVRQKEEAP